MNHKENTLKELANKSSELSKRSALVGFDGFIDKILTPVDKRFGVGNDFEPIQTINEFGKRISDAAGKSTNIELFPTTEKLGGNGPIMANSLLSAGLKVNYIGALGMPKIHSLFDEFAKKTNAVSICEPGLTNAVEFSDGKILFGEMASLDQITYQKIIDVMEEGPFYDLISRADIFAMVNWTMIPKMTQIFTDLLEKALPNLGPRDNRIFFFDLADPEKRTAEELESALKTIAKFRSHGSVTLGLNLKEAQQVDLVLGNKQIEPDVDGMKKIAHRIRQELDISHVVIHSVKLATCSTKDDVWSVLGPYEESPLISTGAGDHFNAGFVTAQTLGLSPISCLTLAATFSGYYVKNAKSPTIGEIENFIKNWR